MEVQDSLPSREYQSKRSALSSNGLWIHNTGCYVREGNQQRLERWDNTDDHCDPIDQDLTPEREKTGLRSLAQLMPKRRWGPKVPIPHADIKEWRGTGK
jgi:hypothetical protein